MTRIGILSDTHGALDKAIFDFFGEVDEIWHAGDIGDYSVIEELQSLNKPIRAVYGNIDNHLMRMEFPEFQLFHIEDATILMTHICRLSGRYTTPLYHRIQKHRPNLLVCGHSHILKVNFDKSLNMLHINPGAFGYNGFHKVRTAIRVTIDGSNFKDLEILELPRHR